MKGMTETIDPTTSILVRYVQTGGEASLAGQRVVVVGVADAAEQVEPMTRGFASVPLASLTADDPAALLHLARSREGRRAALRQEA